MTAFAEAEPPGRLIELSTATAKPDEVMKWQAERAKDPAVAPPPRPVRK